MNKTAPLVALLAGIVVSASFALAQSKVDQGKPGTQGGWPVTVGSPISLTIPDGGLSVFLPTPVYPADGGHPTSLSVVDVVPYPCNTSKETTYLMDGGVFTLGSLNPRLYVVACNTSDNTAGVVRCRGDGTAPIVDAGSAGTVLSVGSCVPYINTIGQPVKCVGASNYLSAYECGP
jgi:hypothetical protein